MKLVCDTSSDSKESIWLSIPLRQREFGGPGGSKIKAATTRQSIFPDDLLIAFMFSIVHLTNCLETHDLGQHPAGAIIAFCLILHGQILLLPLLLPLFSHLTASPLINPFSYKSLLHDDPPNRFDTSFLQTPPISSLLLFLTHPAHPWASLSLSSIYNKPWKNPK